MALDDGRTPLMDAVAEGNTDVIKVRTPGGRGKTWGLGVARAIVVSPTVQQASLSDLRSHHYYPDIAYLPACVPVCVHAYVPRVWDRCFSSRAT